MSYALEPASRAGKVPASWSRGAFRGIYKDGNVLDWENYRLVCLLSNVGKGFERVLLRRVRRVAQVSE